MNRIKRLLEYTCWALALLCVVPLAAAVAGRAFYAGVAAQATDELSMPDVRDEVHSAKRVRANGHSPQPAVIKQNQALWAKGRLAAFKRLQDSNDLALAGVLKIPRLDATIPIFDGTSEAAMTLGAGHLSDTSALTGDGNIALSSHRDGAFRVLKDVEQSEVITLTTNASVRTFAVTQRSIVKPDAIGVLAPTPNTTLTLITCHPFYYVGKAPNRYIVQAELIRKDTATDMTHDPQFVGRESRED